MSNVHEPSPFAAAAIAAESFVVEPLPLLAQYNDSLQLHWQQRQFTAVSPGTNTQTAGAGLFWFGGVINWANLQAILAALDVADDQLQLSLLQPLPELSAGMMIQSAVLSPPAQTLLNALAEQFDCQLVYLTQQPTLAQPGLLVMDMDSTAIQIECIDEIAKLAGVGEQVAAVTARAMNGELDFAQSLRQRVAALAGAPASVLSEVLATLPLMPGLTGLVNHLQLHGWRVAIASGGFTYFTEALQQQLKLDATFANQLEIIDGKLTGEVLGDIVDAKRKAEVIAELVERYHLSVSQTIAIGDGANDLPMLAKASLGVAFHAKPKVQAAAKAAITSGSLLQLLYLVAPA